MKKILAAVVVAVVCLAATASGFDGLRRGFVLGGGLGIAADSKYSVDFLDHLKPESNGAGMGANFVIGGCFDGMNMLVYEGNVTAWKDDLLDENISQGFNGAAWYHYYGQPGKSAFTTVGLGFYIFQAEHYDNNDPGFGMLLGGGYEFAKHWQVGGYLSFGSTSSVGVNFNHSHINFLVSGIAF